MSLIVFNHLDQPATEKERHDVCFAPSQSVSAEKGASDVMFVLFIQMRGRF